jgi:ribose 5-phosphate isomerase B
MTIYFAADHAGFDLKKHLVPYVSSLGFEVKDCGAYTLNPDDDYPFWIAKAARAVSHDSQKSLGIVIGGSGQGEAIVANKFQHVRAAVYYGGNEEIVKLSREHNDANVLSLGARFMSTQEAEHVVKLWLTQNYHVSDRHKRRIKQIHELEHETLGQFFTNLFKPLWQKSSRQ